MTERAPFLVVDGNELRSVFSKLAGFGYSEEAVRKRLGVEDVGSLQWRSTPIYRAAHLSSRDPLAVAIDLFLLQGTVKGEELASLFDHSECDLLIRSGLLATTETQQVVARASLFPVGDRLIFSDHAWPELPHPGYFPVPADQVMSVGGDSRILARCTSRRRVRSALDLCTGSGIHALLASTHSERVLAVDINPRAARCTRFNARVSAADNLDMVVGDLFEPLRGQRFDLITANPPFVPSPLDSLQFRDGGRSGEDVQMRIVAGLPPHLAAGGTARIVTELGEREGEPLSKRVRQWLNGAPMDIHLLRLGEATAIKYATGHAQGEDYESYLRSVDDWAGNLRTQGYERVVTLLISFEWSDASLGAPWERVDESPTPRRDAGAEIDAIFAAERLSRRPGLSDALKESVVHRAGPIALMDARVLGHNIQAKTKATLLGQALQIEHGLDPVEREILVRLDACVRVAELIQALPDFAEASILDALRSLLRRRLISM
jgi:hypothetical protein